MRHKGVRFEEVYPSTDVLYYGSNGKLEYDFVPAATLCFLAGAVLLSWGFLGPSLDAVQILGIAVLWAAVLWSKRRGDEAPGT